MNSENTGTTQPNEIGSAEAQISHAAGSKRRSRPRKPFLIAAGTLAGLSLLIFTVGMLRRSGTSAWAFEQTIDPMTDVPTAAIYSRSMDGAMMQVKCTNGSPLTLSFKADQRLAADNEGRLERVIKFRFDNRPIQDTVGALNGYYIDFANIDKRTWDAPIIAGLPDTDHLTIQSYEVTFTFPTAGAEEMLERVREGCKPTK